jgi:replicative DNA helicase
MNFTQTDAVHGAPLAPPSTDLNLPASFTSSSGAKVPPSNLEAEQATLGAMLMEESVIPVVNEIIEVDDFYRDLHRKIWTAIMTVHAARQAVDIVTVAEWLGRKEILAECGGVDYLSSLIQACPSSANCESYANLVRDLSLKRRAAILSVQATDLAMNGVPAEAAISQLRRSLEALELRAPQKRQTSFNAQALLSMELPEPAWVVPGLLPQGLTILAGNPKLGKSWLALGIALAVSMGGAVLGQVMVEQGEVLYLALEDTARRMQTRLKKILAGQSGQGSVDISRLSVQLEWPTLDRGGVAKLERWLEDHRGQVRLVVIDTFQKVRGSSQTSHATAYGADYEAVAGLKLLADRYNIAIVLVHHRRKGEGMDDLESISGSYGLTGAADGIWSLKRERGRSDAVLFVTGRDVDEQELALKWDATLGSWAILGEAGEYRLSLERAEIVDALRAEGKPLGPMEVFGKGIGKSYASTKQTMWQMSKDGQLRSAESGKYALLSGDEKKAARVEFEVPG